MLYVKNKMVLALALVYKTIMAIHISDADLNVFRIPIVLMIKLVLIRNVWTLVLALVAKMLFVTSSIMHRSVHVSAGIPAMPWLVVIECHSVRYCCDLNGLCSVSLTLHLTLQLNTLNHKILVAHLHVDHSVFVVKSKTEQFVRVSQTLLVDHQIAGPNARHHRNVHETSLAQIHDALILVQELAAWTLDVA